MYYKRQIPPLYEVTRELSDTAMGRVPADVVVTNGTLINVCTGEYLTGMSVAIKHGRVACVVADVSRCIGEDTEIVDAHGMYISPGFMDGHVHIESAMLTVGEYANAAVPHGTTAIFADPHEMCNVLGRDGVHLMMEDARRTPLKTMITVPSCVPSVPGFEDTGAEITSGDVRDMLHWEGVVGLGEMMNFPGIIASDAAAHNKCAETLRAGKIVTGHYSAPDNGAPLDAYIDAGVRCCHESVDAETVIAKLRAGIYVMLREGSVWRDLAAVSKAIVDNEIDTRYAMLVSDDVHPHTLVTEGHMDRVVRHAIAYGIPPMTAIQMATINCAACFKMDDELGSITPGRCADIILFDDLEKINVRRVLINGETVARERTAEYAMAHYVYPRYATHSINVGYEITPDSFKIPAEGESVRARVINIAGTNVVTSETIERMNVINGGLCADASRDILKGFVFERHHSTGIRGCGFIHGFGMECGAMASTVAHDAHNLFVVGTNDADMAVAANALIDCGGGYVVVRDGKVLEIVELPIAGLMSQRSAEDMNELTRRLSDACREIGCALPSPFMTMSFISLPCIPHLRLSDRGIVDCLTFEIVPLTVED